MKWETFASYDALSAYAAELFLGAIHADPRIVFGLPTGRTPVGMYDRVVAICSREYHCFTEVTTFNLDEYAGISCEHPGSYCTYMREHLFDHVDIDRRRTHIPDGTAPEPAEECARYEDAIQRAGGLGLTFLGLGRNGHIGFNEPGTPFGSRTRVVSLTQSTRSANATYFRDGEVPSQAMTMGIGTILESKSIVLLVSGTGKEDAIARLRSREIDEEFPASALHLHGDVQVLIS